MKKALLILTVAIGSFLLWSYIKSSTPVLEKKTPSPKVLISPTVSPQKEKKEYVFVPYWSFTKSLATDSETSLIYFGIGVNSAGIETNDEGYAKLKQFVKLSINTNEKILTLRMTDKNINAQVLKSLFVQEKIASGAVTLATQYKFDGVLLDYETSAFAFDSTTKNITSFYKLFSKEVKENNLKFYVTLYGDTYHQARPFDVKEIGKISDKVIIMAYDFSKSRGNPGPNFPLLGREKYGYDFAKMIDDFQKDVSNEKLVVALGYFGYDWRVDKKGNSLALGIPLSLNEIKKEFINTRCEDRKCLLERLSATEEPSIKYVDKGGENHIIWFEDEASIAKKKEFLRAKGILQTAAWAYSYY